MDFTPQYHWLIHVWKCFYIVPPSDLLCQEKVYTSHVWFSKQDSSDSMVRPMLSEKIFMFSFFLSEMDYYQICQENPKINFQNSNSNVSSSVDTHTLYHQSNCFEWWQITSNVLKNRNKTEHRRWSDHFRINFTTPYDFFTT